jgi:uncharacterized protein (TIGR02147 family)
MKSSYPDVSAYVDFRKYLKDCYEARKSVNPKFSHRFFGKKAGYGSSSYFADVLSGRRSLTATGALRLSRALELAKEEEEYFLQLVNFNQAASLELKNLYYGKLLSRSRIAPDILSRDKYEYFSKWYHAALRELLYFEPCKDDFKALGRKLNPVVPAPQVKKAVALLEKLGMIARDADGFYRQTVALVSTDDLGASLHVENFQTETMKLGIEALERHPAADRDISTLTATLSQESLDKVKVALKELRKCVMVLAEQDQKVDRVVQLNIQLFPLTRFSNRETK